MAPIFLQMHPFPAGRPGKHPIKRKKPHTFKETAFVSQLRLQKHSGPTPTVTVTGAVFTEALMCDCPPFLSFPLRPPW